MSSEQREQAIREATTQQGLFGMYLRLIGVPKILDQLAAERSARAALVAGILQPWPAGGFICVICQQWGETRNDVVHKFCALPEATQQALLDQQQQEVTSE